MNAICVLTRDPAELPRPSAAVGNEESADWRRALPRRAGVLTRGLQPPELEAVHFCCAEAPSLRCPVITL